MGVTELDNKPRRRRRLWRWLWILPLLFLALSVVQVTALRFIDPPFSAFMLNRQLVAWTEGDWDFRLAHDARDLEDISPYLPLAMIASEDQNFIVHRGFDFKAIEKARK